eukprot:15220557-Ditylum_brightwellii.AAC.1
MLCRSQGKFLHVPMWYLRQAAVSPISVIVGSTITRTALNRYCQSQKEIDLVTYDVPFILLLDGQ